MAENMFDQFAKSLAAGTSRRQLLGMMTNGAVGFAWLAFFLPARARAASPDTSGDDAAPALRDEVGGKCPSYRLCNGHCCGPDQCCMRGRYCAAAGDCI
jgi:hypothetical protein